MKVLIVTNTELFLWGGAEELADNLALNLRLVGHDAEVLRIPFFWKDPNEIINQMLLVRNIELYNVDKVIALKFPAYLINHPNISIWLLHQFRQAYDLHKSDDGYFGGLENKKELLDAIQLADSRDLSQVRNVYTISANTSSRLLHFNGIQSTPLQPPVNNQELFVDKGNDGYIFAGGRINNMKRQYLLVEAAALSQNGPPLIIAGPTDSEEDAQKLRELVSRHNLQRRVNLDIGFHPRQKIADYINRSAAVAYIPIDEDYGYVAAEAAIASKPVITCADSGGPLEIIKNEVTGWVCEPSAKALGKIFDLIGSNPKLSNQLGNSNRVNFENLDISWSNIIRKLLE